MWNLLNSRQTHIYSHSWLNHWLRGGWISWRTFKCVIIPQFSGWIVAARLGSVAELLSRYDTVELSPPVAGSSSASQSSVSAQTVNSLFLSLNTALNHWSAVLLICNNSPKRSLTRLASSILCCFTYFEANGCIFLLINWGFGVFLSAVLYSYWALLKAGQAASCPCVLFNYFHAN